MQLVAHVLGLGLGLGFFIKLCIVRHMATQQQLDLVANATTCPCFKVTIRVRVFHQTVYSAPHGSTTTLDLVANVTAGPCFRVRVRVRVFHQTVYSGPHGNTTTVRFSSKCKCWPMF